MSSTRGRGNLSSQITGLIVTLQSPQRCTSFVSRLATGTTPDANGTDCIRWEILFPSLVAIPTPSQSKVSLRMVRSVPCRILAELRPLKSVEPSRLSVFLSFYHLLTCTYSRVSAPACLPLSPTDTCVFSQHSRERVDLPPVQAYFPQPITTKQHFPATFNDVQIQFPLLLFVLHLDAHFADWDY